MQPRPLLPRATDYFSDNYETARARFKKASAGFASRPGSFARSCPVPSEAGADLSVDYLYVPATVDCKNLIVLISGVHGPEGFAGSAIQLMMLEELKARFGTSDTGLFMAHAMNPFGFKFGRRVTEANVNLNRNFTHDESLFDFKNLGYEKISHVLAPKKRVVSSKVSLARLAGSLYGRALSRKWTAQEISAAVSQGQFEFDKGLEYGGRTREPQIVEFINVAAPVIAQYKNIVFLDLHTGLGDRYTAHMLRGAHEKSVNPELFKQLFDLKVDKDLYTYNLPTEKGFYPTLGDSNSLIGEMLKPEQRAVALTLEFGTLGNGPAAKMESLLRLVLENQGHHYGYRSRRQEKAIKLKFQELFAPSDTAWRESTIEKSRQILERVFNRL